MAEFKKFSGRGDRTGRGKGTFGGDKREGGFGAEKRSFGAERGGDRGFGAGRNGEYVSRPRFDRGGDRGGFKKDFKSADRGDREMFQATCDNCGNTCQVPFKPSGDKPVLCDNCFTKKRADSTREYKASPDYVAREDRRDTRTERPVRSFTENAATTNTPRPDQKVNDLQMKYDSLNSKVSELITITKTLTEKLSSLENVKTVAEVVKPKPKTTQKAPVEKVEKIAAKKPATKKAVLAPKVPAKKSTSSKEVSKKK